MFVFGWCYIQAVCALWRSFKRVGFATTCCSPSCVTVATRFCGASGGAEPVGSAAEQGDQRPVPRALEAASWKLYLEFGRRPGTWARHPTWRQGTGRPFGQDLGCCPQTG